MQQIAPPISDFELVNEIRRGVSQAEATLYEKYSARVYYVALGDLRSREDAEDVRAETFLRILQAIRDHRLRSPEALPAFVLSTARNVIREHLRQNRRTEPIGDEPQEREGYEQHHAFLDSDVKNAIEQVVRRLKARERAFLRMYYYEELPKDEIARRLGIKEERLRLIKSRALKSFRQYYERVTKSGYKRA